MPIPPVFAPTLAALMLSASALCAADQKPASARRVAVATADQSLVDLRTACPGVVIELRYASERNLTGKPIYPTGARALLRPNVAERLNRAQAALRDVGFGLKVWDAYRPAWVQKVLWNAVRNPAFVVEPSATGSLHSWGTPVDVTLVDFRGREVKMPTDYDAFTPDARYDYKGSDPEVAFNLRALKRAMADAGFRHIRDEWWHYSAPDPQSAGPIDARLDEPDAKPAKLEPPVVATAPGVLAKPELTKKPVARELASATPVKSPRQTRVVFVEKPRISTRLTTTPAPKKERPRKIRTLFPLRPGETL